MNLRRWLTKNTSLVPADKTKHVRRRYRFTSGFVTPTPIYAYQAIAVATMTDNKSYALLDDMGLGKTLTAIYTAANLITRRVLDCCVVVCPAQLITTWERELEKHLPNVSYVTISGVTKSKRDDLLKNKAPYFYLINYELLSRSIVLSANRRYGLRVDSDCHNLIQYVLNKKRCAIFLDESQSIKSPTSKVTHAAFFMATAVEHRYILTGTPLAERPEDAWSQFYFLDFGESLGASYYEFLNKYCVIRRYGGWNRSWQKIVRYKNLKKLARQIRKKSLRRLKDSVLELPPKLIIEVPHVATKTHLTVMRNLRDKLVSALGASTEKNIYKLLFNANANEESVSSLLNIIRRASVTPSYVTGDLNDDTTPHIADIVNAVENKGRVLVWTAYVDTAVRLSNALSKHRIVNAVLHGKIENKERNRIVELSEKDSSMTLISTMAIMRRGVTLTWFDTAVYTQLPFELEHWKQSQDRIYRIGQRNKVSIIVPLLQQSLDYFIWSMLNRKISVTDVASGDTTKESVLTKESLLDALTCW